MRQLNSNRIFIWSIKLFFDDFEMHTDLYSYSLCSSKLFAINCFKFTMPAMETEHIGPDIHVNTGYFTWPRDFTVRIVQETEIERSLRVFEEVQSAGTCIWAMTWQNHQTDCAPSEDSDQPGHSPSLIRVFAVRLKGCYGPKLSSCGQRRLWSDWADESSLGAHSLCWFCHVVAHLKSCGL